MPPASARLVWAIMGEPWLLALVAGFGCVCGFINVIAGGGSFLSLPLLIFCGLPPTVANGTNRVAILVQNLVAVRTFHRRGMLDWRAGRALIVPLLIGSVLGARIAVSLDQRLMTLAIGAAMASLFVTLLVKPTLARPRPVETPAGASEASADRERAHRPGWAMHVGFFVIGIYGGFIQAGAGLFMVFLLMTAGYDLLRSSAIRQLLILCYTPLALAVFVYSGQVDWLMGMALAIGNATGAVIGIRVAVARGADFARAVLLIVLASCSSKLFYDALLSG